MAPGQPAGAAHQKALERAFGRIFAALVALFMVVFWFSSATLRGQRPGCVVANLVLSVLLIWQAARALRRPPSQRDLCLLAAATGALLMASRALAVPGSPFLADAAYELVTPVAIAWAVWSDRFVVPVPVLLIVLATGVWQLGGDLPGRAGERRARRRGVHRLCRPAYSGGRAAGRRGRRRVVAADG